LPCALFGSTRQKDTFAVRWDFAVCVLVLTHGKENVCRVPFLLAHGKGEVCRVPEFWHKTKYFTHSKLEVSGSDLIKNQD